MTKPTFTIAPWLNLRESLKALSFYKEAFDAVEVYRMDVPDGVIARLSAHGAEFWIGDESPGHGNHSPQTINGSSIRLILTVENPDIVFDQAVKAGAKVIYSVAEEHGWRVGRVEDPFGHHWEIGKMI